jgi:hypothetical protein
VVEKKIETTKRLAAQRQIHGAIEHFNKSEFECAITLAGAGEGILPPTENPHLFTKLKAWFATLAPQTEGENNPNAFITWLKHPGGGDTATITDLEAVVAITRAISKFAAVHSGVTQRMRGFLDGPASQQKPTK